MSDITHPITLEAALHVASNLRPDDRREVEEGHGLDPMEHLTLEARNSSCVYFTMPNGKTAGMGGIEENGMIWMVCTPDVENYPHTFIRAAKDYMERSDKNLLWNIVDKRNKVHLKFLKFLGFKFLREIKYGPNKLSFIEFYYVNRNRTSDRSRSK